MSIVASVATAASRLYGNHAAIGASNGPSPAVEIAAPTRESSVVTISEEARALLAQRQIAETDVQALQSILGRFQQLGPAGDPKAFLGRLSGEDLAVVQRSQCLADPIDVSSLSHEGAANLLVEPGKAQDLDNNGLTQVGAGNFLQFPPQNAPESFKAAWRKASEGMSPLDVPSHMAMNIGLANIRRDPATGMSYSLAPDDPRWVNPYADAGFDYRKEVGTIMEGLTYELEHSMISQSQFDKDMGFYRRLMQAMNA